MSMHCPKPCDGRCLPLHVDIVGVDVPDWLPFMTADELGLDRPKLSIDYATGLEHVTVPTPGTEVAVCSNASVPVEVFDPAILRNALTADASRPLDLRALIEVDQLHRLLNTGRMLDAAGDVSLRTRIVREINATEVS